MINVRIRHAEEANSLLLMQWDPTDLDNALVAVGRWGIYTSQGEYGTEDLTGQIVVDSTRGGAFFEIIINDNE